jgi:spore maturation protein CgeB
MRTPRVLVCGDFSSLTLPHSRQCAAALAEVGCDVQNVDTEDRRRKLPEMLKRWSKSLAKRFGLKQRLSDYYVSRELAVRNDRVWRAFELHQPELVLVIRGNALDPVMLARMQQRGASVVGWWIKDVRRLQNLVNDVPHYDAYYCIHSNLCSDRMRYLPAWNLDRERYYPAEVSDHRYDVVFVGIWNPKRQTYLDRLAGYNLGIVGPGWSTRTLTSNPALARHVVKNTMHGEELTRFYQSARIVININQWDPGEATGTTLRVVDVPACGALLLTEYSADLEDLFVLEQEISAFASPGEMQEKVDYFLAHEAERDRIARAGLLRVLDLPTPRDRMERLLSEIYPSDMP